MTDCRACQVASTLFCAQHTVQAEREALQLRADEKLLGEIDNHPWNEPSRLTASLGRRVERGTALTLPQRRAAERFLERLDD